MSPPPPRSGWRSSRAPSRRSCRGNRADEHPDSQESPSTPPVREGEPGMIRFAAAAIAFLVAPALVRAQAPDGALKKIRDTKSVTIAFSTDAIPFSFADEKGQPAGYTVDLCKRVVASLEQQLMIPVLKVNWTPATAQNRFDLIGKRKADLECGATTATLSRMEVVDFSSFVFVDTTGLLVRTSSGVKAFADLAG